jgi:hypothetical protein
MAGLGMDDDADVNGRFLLLSWDGILSIITDWEADYFNYLLKCIIFFAIGTDSGNSWVLCLA